MYLLQVGQKILIHIGLEMCKNISLNYEISRYEANKYRLFSITFGSVFMCNKITKVRNSCVCGVNFLSLISSNRFCTLLI
jgi:hypothetical protein